MQAVGKSASLCRKKQVWRQETGGLERNETNSKEAEEGKSCDGSQPGLPRFLDPLRKRKDVVVCACHPSLGRWELEVS